MSNPMPIYSQVVPKSQFKSKPSKTSTRPQNLRTDFDPLNYNYGGNFNLMGSPLEPKMENRPEKREEKREKRVKDETRGKKIQAKGDPNEGKVEAYLRQNQVNMRQQQHRYSAVRQAEHRVNLRSLPLTNAATSRGHDRTPTDRHRGFPEKDKDRDREHRRERDRDRDMDEFDVAVSPPPARHDRPVRKSSSAHKVTEPGLVGDKRRFFCREWVFQKIAHCLEQRPSGKSTGAIIIGDPGSGKTALCQELSEPGQGAQARQQRALNRRMLARHFLQSTNSSSLRPGELVRSLVLQILSHSSRRTKLNAEKLTPSETRRYIAEEDALVSRFQDLCDDNEEISQPLLADSEEQRTSSEEAWPGNRTRTIERIHEREQYLDAMIPDAQLTHVDDLPEILPRTSIKPTNPFLTSDETKQTDAQLYENHENLFLRNISQRQSKELRNSRLLRQSSEPLNEKKPSLLQKSLSTDQKEQTSSDEKPKESTNSPPKSRIPVANFKYPNKSDIKPNSVENSPAKRKDTKEKNEELPEYQNVLSRENQSEEKVDMTIQEQIKESKEDVPPPIPSLPVHPRTLIANAYYEKLLSDPEIQQALLPQNLERNPDECFKKALLFPLLEIDPPKQCLFLLVDAIDEGFNSQQLTDTSVASSTCASLVLRHAALLPSWLLLLCTARRNHTLTRLLPGFRKITIDELSRAHVSADVQRYVLARLDTEPRLRSRVSSDTTAAAAAAAALDHLRIKSDGCLLYLEKVLDGVADGFIALREIREIPGTLNGLYLWLAQRLFHGRRFTKVRLLLDVLLAARCGVTEEMLYRCLLTKEYSLTREDFSRRLHLLRRIVVQDGGGHLSIFHHSFSRWLLDVKHCTRRYLCHVADGHALLAMYYTLHATRLTALEIHNYVFHMTQLEAHWSSQKKGKNSSVPEGPLDLHTLTLLWILDSGCDVDSAVKREDERSLRDDEDQVNENNNETIEIEDIDENAFNKPADPSPLESIMPELCTKDNLSLWTADARVLRTLKELSNKRHGSDIEAMDPPQDPEPSAPEEDLDEEVDEATIIELATNGDDDKLAAIIKRHPSVISSCGSAALQAAARGGRAGAARLLCGAGADAGARDSAGWTALRAAAWAGHSEVVDVLLEYGCDVDCVDADNRTALRAAAWSGHLPVVHRLLAGGARPDLADAEGRTPLIAAAYMGHADIVAALIHARADIHHSDHDGRTALSVAALCASGAECVSVLVEKGADVNQADRDGATPLLVAAFEGHTEICELLLESEADLEATDAAGRTCLWAAAAAGHARTVRLLLFWGASVDGMDKAGRTVLSVAAAQGNVEVVRQLLDRGLDEHHRDNSGWTPLHYAAFEGHQEVCEALLEAGAKVDEADNDGKSAVMLAAQEGHLPLVCALVDQWAAPTDQRAHDGKTAFRLAALEGHLECVRALFVRGADVDAVDADRRSTLYVLALDNRLAMASFLITECGAAADITDHEGRTPLHVSAWQGHTDMVNLLIKVGGAEVDQRDRCGRSALHAAAWRGRGAALAALLAGGADAAAVCAQGASPLGIAAQEGHEECVLRLLQHGADPLQADHCGRTPAKVAWRAGHANICRLLERWTNNEHRPGSPELKRRSVHSNSTKSSSNMTTNSRDEYTHNMHSEKASRANLSLSFAQQVARCGRGRRDRDRDTSIDKIPEHDVLKNELRSYAAHERDGDIHGNTSPLYASPPRSPTAELASPGSQPPSLTHMPTQTDTHFNRDTHMRIILGRESKPPDRNEGKNKRNGIVTNPAMRLVANVRNGLDSAAANIRRTGVALAASASSNNPAVKTNAFQWRKETPL